MGDFEKSYSKLCMLFDTVAEGREDVEKLKKLEPSLPFAFDEFCEANGFISAGTWEEAISEYLVQIEKGERLFIERN